MKIIVVSFYLLDSFILCFYLVLLSSYSTMWQFYYIRMSEKKEKQMWNSCVYSIRNTLIFVFADASNAGWKAFKHIYSCHKCNRPTNEYWQIMKTIMVTSYLRISFVLSVYFFYVSYTTISRLYYIPLLRREKKKKQM